MTITFFKHEKPATFTPVTITIDFTSKNEILCLLGYLSLAPPLSSDLLPRFEHNEKIEVYRAMVDNDSDISLASALESLLESC